VLILLYKIADEDEGSREQCPQRMGVKSGAHGKKGVDVNRMAAGWN